MVVRRLMATVFPISIPHISPSRSSVLIPFPPPVATTISHRLNLLLHLPIHSCSFHRPKIDILTTSSRYRNLPLHPPFLLASILLPLPLTTVISSPLPRTFLPPYRLASLPRSQTLN
ncbi:hypothetical protein E2C01_067289 [Portunus trituberculatus]|uniref:Uncharacterized protein n=1 Tax=Portunus trituberculatus TaxID=210409 RepID=A0A5B7HS81_PORTR|nr:hypothetical protein [Portunus trituberculatus]